MNHSLTLQENTRADVKASLLNPPHTPYEALTCPRWLNKELKFLMSTLHVDMTKIMLYHLHRSLRDSREKTSSWATCFIGLLTLSIVTESMQVSVRCKEETDKEMGIITNDAKVAESEIRYMDERLDLLMRFFQKKFGVTECINRKAKKTEFNPIQNLNDRNLLDRPAHTLAQNVERVIKSHGKLSAVI